MGYYTRYNMEALSDNYMMTDIVTYMRKEFEKNDSFYPFQYNLEDILESCEINTLFLLESDDEAKWYEHDEEMKALSIKFKDVLFKLHGEGEDNGDVWDKYYKNGKEQVCNAEITIPPFNEGKLR